MTWEVARFFVLSEGCDILAEISSFLKAFRLMPVVGDANTNVILITWHIVHLKLLVFEIAIPSSKIFIPQTLHWKREIWGFFRAREGSWKPTVWVKISTGSWIASYQIRSEFQLRCWKLDSAAFDLHKLFGPVAWGCVLAVWGTNKNGHIWKHWFSTFDNDVVKRYETTKIWNALPSLVFRKPRASFESLKHLETWKATATSKLTQQASQTLHLLIH